MQKQEKRRAGKGARRSKQRQLILDVLRATTSHPTAEWIHAEVKKHLPQISLGTVYRNLKLLRDQGEILELNYSHARSRFDGNPVDHYHFTCRLCDRVFDLPLPLEQGLARRVEETTGFRVEGQRTEFTGICRECLATAATKEKI